MGESQVLFIAGPTASGKSAAALALGEKLGGEIVNADAMQVYRDLRIITARPSAEDERRLPHWLYGVFGAEAPCSAGIWARRAAAHIDDILGRGKAAIVVGGTGLYFRALEEGLSPIPEIAPEFRNAAQRRREELGPEAFRAEVVARDPAMARLPEGDAQRLIRAWEVYEATGEPLSHFQTLPRVPLIHQTAAKALILPPRQTLYARCDFRAAEMVSSGGIEEVEALLARGLDPLLPAMKTLGVPEIAAYLKGEASREEALEMLQQATRRFAKRQTTWFRNQTSDWPRYETAEEVVAALAG